MSGMTRSRELILKAKDARIQASTHAGDQHYAHWDPTGGAGSGCPACASRSEANGTQREARSRKLMHGLNLIRPANKKARRTPNELSADGSARGRLRGLRLDLDTKGAPSTPARSWPPVMAAHYHNTGFRHNARPLIERQEPRPEMM